MADGQAAGGPDAGAPRETSGSGGSARPEASAEIRRMLDAGGSSLRVEAPSDPQLIEDHAPRRIVQPRVVAPSKPTGTPAGEGPKRIAEPALANPPTRAPSPSPAPAPAPAREPPGTVRSQPMAQRPAAVRIGRPGAEPERDLRHLPEETRRKLEALIEHGGPASAAR